MQVQLTSTEMSEDGTCPYSLLPPTSPRGWLVLRSMDSAQITTVGDNRNLFPHSLHLS